MAGSGVQTIGTDVVTLNWSDGTNSGSIVVTQADQEVELVGAGADGLKLSFSAGSLTAGDSFQVSSFSPLLQEASDARIALGSQGGAGSPIVVTSDTNSFGEVLEGLNVSVSQVTAPGDWVTVNASLDTQSIEDNLRSFIDAYNGVVDFIEEQNSYDADSETSGVLFGDATLWTIRQSLSSLVGNPIEGIDSKYSQLYSLGIRTKSDGHLGITDSSRLREALDENLEDVINLFTSAGFSSRANIELSLIHI